MPRPYLFFDFGGTLAHASADLDEPWRVWVRVAGGLGIELPVDRLRAADQEADQRFQELSYSYHGRSAEFWKLRDGWMIDQLGVRERKEELIASVQAIFDDPSNYQIYPETRGTLEELVRAGYPIGVISNATDRLPAVLRHLGLADFFHTVTYSQEVGADKPDPRIFATALARAGRSPAEAIHIGDTWEADYVGARGAGVRAIWVNRHGGDPPEACEMVRDLRGLPPLLARGATGSSPT